MRGRERHTLVFWVFLTPILLAFLAVIIIPFFLGVYYSFTDWTASAQNQDGLKFVGFENYVGTFQDPRFLYSLLATTGYTLVNILVINVVAFGLALLVASPLKLKGVYRAGFFIPNLIGGLVLGFVWNFIFNNAVPTLGPLIGLDFLADPNNFMLANNISATLGMVIVATWQSAGYYMMIYLAALQAVPEELYEAAAIDGAGRWRRIFSITLPMVAPAFTITMFLTLVSSFKVFDVNVSLTAGGPSTMFWGEAMPGTQMLALNIYNTAFSAQNMAEAQARAVLFFLILMVISLIQVWYNKKKEIEL